MRDVINKYGVPIAIGVIVLALLLLVFRRSTPKIERPENLNSAFYVDEDSGEESIHPVTDLPPLLGNAGKPSVVQAIKYSCDGGKTAQVHYYMKYTDAAKSELSSLPKDKAVADMRRSEILQTGQLVRAPATGSQWVPANSPEGQTVVAFPTCPDGQQPVIVHPR